MCCLPRPLLSFWCCWSFSLMALCVFYLNKSKQQETICVHGIIATTTVTIILFTSRVSVGTYISVLCIIGVFKNFNASTGLFTHFWLHLKSGSLVVFHIWCSTGCFCRTPSFRVHILRLYQDKYSRRLTYSS